jgi:hypothetical protein
VNDLSKSLRLVAHDALSAAKKRRQISACFKKQGFIALGKGGWLGFRNQDIVSGFVVEGSPLDTYISTFVLPAFDRRDFITWGLGGRVVPCDLQRDTHEECKQAVDSYTASISIVRSATDLINYLGAQQPKGHYPIWVTYLCYLRLLDLDTATQYLDDGRRNLLHSVRIQQFEEINRFAVAHDKKGVVSVLASWSAFSERIFGPLDQTFSVY